MKNVLKVLLLTLFFYSAWAHAHVELSSSTPAKGDVLSSAPTEIVLNFSGEARLAKVMLHTESGEMIALNFSMSMEPRDKYEITIEDELASGNYTVYWVAMGGDSHKISGDFSFKVKQ